MRHLCHLLLALCFLGSYSIHCSASLDAASFVYTLQQKKRDNRAALLEEYLVLKSASYKRYNKAIYKVGLIAAKNGQLEYAMEIYEEIVGNDPKFKKLHKLEELIENSEEKTNPKKLAAAHKGYANAQKGYARVLMPFTQKLIEKKLYGLTYDNLQQILICDPKNRKARKYLGHKFNRKEKKWMNTFETAQLKDKKLIWSDTLGWILAKERNSYTAEHHYDYTDGTWGTRAELDVKHSTLDTAWPIVTHHFIVYAACDLDIGIEAANALEGLYQAWIRDFVSFFGNLAIERMFDKTIAPRKLKVYLFKSRDQYLEFNKRKGFNDPLLAESAGYYSSGLTSSQFYLAPDWMVTLWHEVTHQLFGENANSSCDRTALAEGLAVYMQHGRMENGRIILNLSEHVWIQDRAEQIRAGEPKTFASIWNLTHDDFHGEKRGANYNYAGLCVFFIMQYDNGRFAPDFIDYVTTCYQFGKEDMPLHDYLGISKQALEKYFQEWKAVEFPKE